MLCGGGSRRMGADKATIEIDGVPMARRVAEALLAAGATGVDAIGGDPTALARLGLEPHPDLRPGQGPLAAVIRALEVASEPVVAVLACDLLAPDPGTILRLVVHRHRTDADVAVAVSAGRPQWVHAVWHRRVAAVLDAVLESGERSLVGATAGLRAELVDVADPEATRDADHPADLPAASRRQAFGS